MPAADESREARQSGKKPDDPRQPFQIDRDRILYSSAFRRLAGVTQVVSPGEGEIFHNRLTHSLKVAQIARRLAEKLGKDSTAIVESWGGLDPDVAEAAALAHDLGHPPFGHIAEEELQELVSHAINPPKGEAEYKPVEGYEGNAQSFRIVTELSTRRPGSEFGLDLTRATLNATLKYPWKWLENAKKPEKFGAYACDETAFKFAREVVVVGGEQARSLEAQIMDWADDITYSIHDTEDFYRAGLIPLDRLASNPKERSRFRTSLRERWAARNKPLEMDGVFDKVFDGLFENLPIAERFEGTREQQERLYEFVSGKIAKYVRETKLLPTPGKGGEALDISTALKLEIFLLKELTWTYVIENPALASHQHGQRKAIRTLFEAYNEAADAGRWTLFPAYYRERGAKSGETYGKAIPTPERVRLIADTISSMTDKQALIIYQQFTGISPSSMLDPVMS
jgi:dGTPase